MCPRATFAGRKLPLFFSVFLVLSLTMDALKDAYDEADCELNHTYTRIPTMGVASLSSTVGQGPQLSHDVRVFVQDDDDVDDDSSDEEMPLVNRSSRSVSSPHPPESPLMRPPESRSTTIDMCTSEQGLCLAPGCILQYKHTGICILPENGGRTRQSAKRKTTLGGIQQATPASFRIKRKNTNAPMLASNHHPPAKIRVIEPQGASQSDSH